MVAEASRFFSNQKAGNLFVWLFLCVTVGCTGCVSKSYTEERAVDLPDGHPATSLEEAAKIGQALAGGSLLAGVQKEFPSLTQQQLQGLFITWNAVESGGKKTVFLKVGIRYTGTLPEAKAIADFCKLQVQSVVAERFRSYDMR